MYGKNCIASSRFLKELYFALLAVSNKSHTFSSLLFSTTQQSNSSIRPANLFRKIQTIQICSSFACQTRCGGLRFGAIAGIESRINFVQQSTANQHILLVPDHATFSSTFDIYVTHLIDISWRRLVGVESTTRPFYHFARLLRLSR